VDQIHPSRPTFCLDHHRYRFSRPGLVLSIQVQSSSLVQSLIRWTRTRQDIIERCASTTVEKHCLCSSGSSLESSNSRAGGPSRPAALSQAANQLRHLARWTPDDHPSTGSCHQDPSNAMVSGNPGEVITTVENPKSTDQSNRKRSRWRSRRRRQISSDDLFDERSSRPVIHVGTLAGQSSQRRLCRINWDPGVSCGRFHRFWTVSPSDR
jgi:hypothetical protein